MTMAMQKRFQYGISRRDGLLAVLILFMQASAGLAAGEHEAVDTAYYAGLFAGSGWVDNHVVDVEGFANWGQPGWKVDHQDSGFVAGALAGRQFGTGRTRFRIEVDGTLGNMSATSNQLDPATLDETVKSEFRWITTARAGVVHPVGPATLFASAGAALARISNSVTDIDFGPDMPPRKDPDDSFHDSSNETGWVIGLGVEAPLSDAWNLRFEGMYMDFGRSTHHVNRSSDARCGPGNPRKPCPYRIENTYANVRLAVIRRF